MAQKALDDGGPAAKAPAEPRKKKTRPRVKGDFLPDFFS